jgi:hypothetical protein
VKFQRWGVLGDRAVPDLWAELGRIIDRWQIRLLPLPPEPADPPA